MSDERDSHAEHPDPGPDRARTRTPRARLAAGDRALWDRAVAVVRANDTGAFVKPSLGQYPHQWNWDAALIAVGLRHVDPERARKEVRALLLAQWSDGMVPHIIYHDGPSDYFPTPAFWRTGIHPAAPAVATSGLTQPPVLATAVRRIHEAADDRDASRDFVAEVYPQLLAWHRWMRSARDPDGTGLVALIHPWESGTDNSTRWAAILERMPHVAPPPYERRDQHHVATTERPVPADYDRFIHLIGLFRDLGWRSEALYRESPFLVQDALFNAVLHRADEDLRALARELGEDVQEIDAWRDATARAFRERLWHDGDGLYYDLDLRTNAPIRESTCASLAPLYAGLPSEAQAKRVIREHLRNPGAYAPDGEGYFVPSASKASPYFEPRRYWRGPVWIVVNWLLYDGLRRYGEHELARTIREHSLELVRHGAFTEYYDPRDGTPLGARAFSWSAALTLDFLQMGNG